jgi:SP family facilitated glucose transporter-like MFS transporter 3
MDSRERCVQAKSATASIAVVSFPFLPFLPLTPQPSPYTFLTSLRHSQGVNWLTNFLVGVFFLPLRDFLGSYGGSGTVFYVFTVCTAVGAVVVGRLVR